MITSARSATLSRTLSTRIGLGDRKSTRLNSSHGYNSYAVFCLKKKNRNVHLASDEHRLSVPSPLAQLQACRARLDVRVSPAPEERSLPAGAHQPMPASSRGRTL